MAFWHRKPTSITIQGESVRSVVSHGEPNPQEKSIAALKRDMNYLQSGLSPGDVFGVDAVDLDLAAEYGLTIFNESARYAIWQKLVSPWMASPGMVAIHNKVCNRIAALPVCQINEETGEKKSLPPLFRMPLGTDNPSFGIRPYWRQSISSLFRFGDMINPLIVNNAGRPIRMIPSSAERVRVKPPFTAPRYDFYPGAVSIVGTNPTEGQFTAENYPAAKVLHISNMASPETNRGVPIGLMITQNVAAILGSQEYTARFFGDANWQQTLFHPPYQMDNYEGYKAQMEALLKATKANHSTVATDAPVEVKRLGFNAQEAMLNEMLKSSQQVLAVAHNIPYGMISPEKATHAQLYVESEMFISDVAEPLIVDLEDEHTRILESGWRVHFDRSKLFDPKSLLDMLVQGGKAGMMSINKACLMMGWDTFGDINDEDNPYNKGLTDGNRTPVDMLEELAEAKTQKGKQSVGDPGGDTSPEREEPPAPSDEA